ncbi:MAG: hypothetical protein ACD_5C00222G0003 [uncultured bacterium]|nr:MAG: hypothetical protein ACD_5C00222G0003 [uncultured bacterium]
MSVNLLVYGVFAYFALLVMSGVIGLWGKYLKSAQKLFVASNFLGFLTGLVYFTNFASQNLVLANWQGFFNFAPTLNLLSAIFFTVISGVSTLVGVYSLRYLELYKDTYNPATTHFLSALFVLGMQGTLLANNAFGFLFFWEVMSISSFFLVFADKEQQSLKAAFLYFIMTHLGASAIMGGFLILSGGDIFFEFSQLSVAIENLPGSLKILTFLLFLFGFGSKAGLVPFHVWLPEAHPQAPSNISAMMSGLMLKVAVYGFIKVAFAFSGLPAWTGIVVIALGLISAVVGVLYAVIERDMKRAFAYSSIENMGIIFTMLGLALYILSVSSDSSVAAFANVLTVFAIFHAISHALFKTSLFLASGVIISRVHTKSLEFMGGLAKLMPVFSFAFLISILSSLPLPPFGTFYGEWGFIQNIINLLHSDVLETEVRIVMLLAIAVMGLVSGLAVFAMVKIFGISMLGLTRAEHLEKRNEKTDYLLTMPIMILGILVIVLGIFAKNIIAFLTENSSKLAFSGEASFNETSELSSISIFIAAALFGSLVWIMKKYFHASKTEREHQTWDCGQPINSSMEYTATAFSAPIRFFFLQLLGRDKKVVSAPVVESNPWIRKYTFSMSLTSVWKDKLYEPVAIVLNFFAERFKVIQGGRIQYYLLFVLGTLIITLIIAL